MLLPTAGTNKRIIVSWWCIKMIRHDLLRYIFEIIIHWIIFWATSYMASLNGKPHKILIISVAMISIQCLSPIVLFRYLLMMSQFIGCWGISSKILPFYDQLKHAMADLSISDPCSKSVNLSSYMFQSKNPGVQITKYNFPRLLKEA